MAMQMFAVYKADIKFPSAAQAYVSPFLMTFIRNTQQLIVGGKTRRCLTHLHTCISMPCNTDSLLALF